MKKLIAISVVFALIAGVAFAVDLSGTVIGHVNVLQGNTGEDSKVTSGGNMDRLRIDGSGEVADGAFGGFFRADGGSFYGNAWWKPIDQFKLLIGSNGGDGFIGKEGITGWGFTEAPTDAGIVLAGENVWGKSIYGYEITFRDAFFEGGGDGGNAAYLFITPMDMLAINVILPFFNGGETADVFKKVVGQLDLKFDFGNIAVTYVGGKGYKEGEEPTATRVHEGDPTKGKWVVDDTGVVNFEADKDKWELSGDGNPVDDPASIFAYYGGSFGDISIDFGFGYKFASADGEFANPIAIGLGIKYAVDTFGVKFRTVAKLAGDDKCTRVLADVLPYFNLADNLTVFVGAGLGVLMPDGEDTTIGWHFNPYLQVGEGGANFYAGVQVWSDGIKDAEDKTTINWGVPVGLIVSF
jgi:hypothetical protein